ncbi:DUF2637 domain-containing protein, partial [Streptomyces sp. NPDC096080]|uniref:DUF2637 domain-containing protein n=1 Tax=Streptomyces sp. NPDC096080 TaxID=3156693 RepID=UPI003332EF3D
MPLLPRFVTRRRRPAPGTPAAVPSAPPTIPSARPGVPSAQESVPSARPSVPSADVQRRPWLPFAQRRTRSAKTRTRAVPSAPVAVPGARPGVPSAQESVPRAAHHGLNLLALLGGLGLAGIGFYGSYRALVRMAEERGFGDFAAVFPIGVDVGIVVLYALDLVLTRRRIRWPLVRLTAHAFTAATIIFNAASGGRSLTADPVGVGMHAVIPVMFVIAVEASRRVIVQVTRLEAIEAGEEARESIPRERWLLNPLGSYRLFRDMVLLRISSYQEAVDRRCDQLIYRAELDRLYPKGERYPRGWKSAPKEALLPITMARYGLTVAEALAIPEQARQAEADQTAQQQETAEQEAVDAQIRAADARIRLLAKQAEVAEAEERAEARKSVASVASRAAYAKASAVAEAEERVAIQEAEATESALAAAAARQAAADRAAAAAATAEADRLEAEAAAARRAAADS